MIKGRCFTNLDEYRHKQWPTVFACVPEKGERVKARDGSTLVVVQITHAEQLAKTYYPEPFIEVELWLPVGGAR